MAAKRRMCILPLEGYVLITPDEAQLLKTTSAGAISRHSYSTPHHHTFPKSGRPYHSIEIERRLFPEEPFAR